MPSLLRTKLQIPPINSKHISRKRLMFNTGINADARIVLVSAPAGFGKSSCLIEWAHHLAGDGVMLAWYALDEQDNDPARFAAYLLAAFRSLGAVFHMLPKEDARMDVHEAVNQILNVTADYAKPVVLVLDDYHLITAPTIHDAMSRMGEYLPPNMRLAIGTRADPPLQLARLRARGEVAEIRMADLRFSSDELANWLHVQLGWQPSNTILKQVHALTEGWAAAITLILTSQSYADERALEKQLARYSQSQRHIFDYFADEILENQTDDMRQFLLDTCVLNQLEPALCSALTQNRNAPRLLNELAGNSLFIIPLSNTDPIYRYHHLFVQFLRQYLIMHDHKRFMALHRRAADWYQAHALIVEAVHHALEAEEFDYAADLITGDAWERLTSRGEIMTLVHWVRRFPDKALRRHPRLCLYFSRALYLIGEAEQSQNYVNYAVSTLDNDPDETQDRQLLRAIAFNYQATLAAYRGDTASGLAWIDKARALHDQVSPLDKVRIANTDAFLQYLIGDVSRARQAYEQALTLARHIEHDYLMLDAHAYLAQVDLMAGELQAVQDRCEAVLKQYQSEISPVSTVMLPLASVQYQRNQRVAAETTLRDAIALAQFGNIRDVLWLAHLSLAEVLLTRGEIDEARACFQKARSDSKGFHSPMMASFIAATEARLMLRSGQSEAAFAWADQNQTLEPTGYQQDYKMLTLARIWLVRQAYEQALTLVEQVCAESQPAGRIDSVMTAQMLRALIHQATGEMEAAFAALEIALKLARPQRIMRLFIDEGKPMRDLLRGAVERGITPDYAADLLDIAADDAMQHPADLLTGREIEVLAQIADGSSNQDIADTLVISVGTVKSHIHHIMSKLDAQNRTEAVSKARSLNILAD